MSDHKPLSPPGRFGPFSEPYGGPDPDNQGGPWTNCRTHQPDRTEWCWACTAADALENNT